MRESPQVSTEWLDRPCALVTLLVSMLVLVTGGVVLFGWAHELPLLKSLHPAWVSMKPNTAVGFILAGLAMLPLARPAPRAQRLSRLFALLFGLLGLLSLSEYLFDWNPGFDQWLFPEAPGTVGTSHPGRMAPHTAFCFLLLAIGIGLAWEKARRIPLLTSVSLGLLVASLALVDLFCHFIRPCDVFGLWGLTVMAVHTALLFALLGLFLAWGAWPKDLSPWSLTGKTISSLSLWTLMLVGSLMWSLLQEGQDTLNSATDTARASIRKDISFRRWATSHGGVYVKPNEQTPPNPYLKLSTRDVVTTDGVALTLMNPAYMLREMQNRFGDDYGTQSHITSLKPFNPNNAPDAWEIQALTRFAQGHDQEFFAVTQKDGQPFLRMMAPLLVESGCLKCHFDQGYAIGDIRGGISSSVPLAPLLKTERQHSNQIALAYSIIWGIGMAGLLFFFRRDEKLTIANRQEKAFAEKAINSLPGIFYAYEDGLRLVRWNKNLETLSGYSPAELFGKHPLSWFTPQEKGRIAGEFDKLPAREEIKFETEFLFQQTAMPILFTASWLLLGQKRYLIGVGFDLSEQKRMELATARTQALLGQAQKMETIGVLAGGIAHDFNNILAAILGFTEMARDDSQPGSPVAHNLDKVLIAAHRAKELVKQILAFSRQAPAARIAMEIQPIVKESIKMMRAVLPSTISLREDIHPHCGTILADPTQIHQIIMNLCTNASHAMEATGGELSVMMRKIPFASQALAEDAQLAPGDYVEVTVADTGTGIGPDIIDKIFDPYFTTKEIGKGTGMGLSITHGIVKSYGGAITVKSAVGEGTSFHVYFPVIRESGGKSISEDATAPVGKGEILFVDDEELLAEMGKIMLERLGYSVTVHHRGNEALAAFTANPARFDLVITDQTMPGLTGVELARQILAIRPGLPIILCTGFSQMVDEESAKVIGIKEFAIKPLTKSSIATLVRKLLDREIAS